MNISVVGAGTMGNGIAHVFAQNGFNVALIDVSEQQLEKAVTTISRNLDRQLSAHCKPRQTSKESRHRAPPMRPNSDP